MLVELIVYALASIQRSFSIVGVKADAAIVVRILDVALSIYRLLSHNNLCYVKQSRAKNIRNATETQQLTAARQERRE